jgi:hypothetical protein
LRRSGVHFKTYSTFIVSARIHSYSKQKTVIEFVNDYIIHVFIVEKILDFGRKSQISV